MNDRLSIGTKKGLFRIVRDDMGGLWVSENQGDDWQCVSAHPPPINSVCFEAS